MNSQLFTYGALTIEYVVYGDGPEVIFCFHGFGRKAQDFSIFQSVLLPHQRIVSINLFAHEGSVFPEERIVHSPLEKLEWKNLLHAFMKYLQIEKFRLVGYSMGGRVALVTMEVLPENVMSVLLLAPDGFKINPLYRFASGTALGRWIYRSIMRNPAALFNIAKWLNKIGLLNDKLHRFVHVHMDTYEKRWQVYEGWLIYKKMFPDKDALVKIIQSEKIPFYMIFGKFDSVITPKLGYKFCQKIGSQKSMHVLPIGHRLLTDETVRYVRENGLF